MMKPAEQYEYIHGQVTRPGFVVLDGETEERSFNEMGAQGWMLYPPNGTIAYFYRPVSLVQQIETKELDVPVIMHPSDWNDIHLHKDENGAYFFDQEPDKAVDYPPANPRPGKLPAKPRSRR